MEELNLDATLRVFATDLDESAINLARTGLYPSSIIADEINSQRIAKFFDSKGSYFQASGQDV